jgi:hypothetical protein
MANPSFLHGEYIGEYCSCFSFTSHTNQTLEFMLGYRVISLEDAQGFMPCCRHDAEVIMARQSPVIDGSVSQIVKGEVRDSCPLASCGEAPFHL